MIAEKAKKATALMQLFAQARLPKQKQAIAEQLDQIFPDIRCAYHNQKQGFYKGEGLLVYYLEDRVKRVPHALLHGASIVVAFQASGLGIVKKHQHQVKTFSPNTVVELQSAGLFNKLKGQEAMRLSRWKRIGTDWL